MHSCINKISYLFHWWFFLKTNFFNFLFNEFSLQLHQVYYKLCEVPFVEFAFDLSTILAQEFFTKYLHLLNQNSLKFLVRRSKTRIFWIILEKLASQWFLIGRRIIFQDWFKVESFSPRGSKGGQKKSQNVPFPMKW